MIRINKGNEPIEWTKYCATAGVDYQRTPELALALLREQGFICAYCMRKIPTTVAEKWINSVVEHIKCRTKYGHLKLIYTNMVICCPGRINSEAHCDDSKGDLDITFNLFKPLLEQSIKYLSKNGSIYSTNAIWNNEINNIIKLNNNLLRKNRLKALEGVQQLLEKENWRPAVISTQLEYWSSLHLDTTDNEMKRIEYCGIIIWYLQKTLRRP
jgi:uncharacterized protein (TIGR02646 family)